MGSLSVAARGRGRLLIGVQGLRGGVGLDAATRSGMDRLRCAHCGEVIGVYEHPPDNHLILMSRQAQLALLTDLLLHSNLFFLVFEDGETGQGEAGPA